MPHLRDRALESRIRHALKWSPVVSLLGMRQVGKSTLVKSICKSYFTLDDDNILTQLKARNWEIIESAIQPVAIDECQKESTVFDRVKLIVDRRRSPGSFILTGSVRFLQMKAIRESLTGRTAILELLPLTAAEIYERPLFDFCEKLFKGRSSKTFVELLRARHWIKSEDCMRFLQTGGLPGICFKRDPGIRADLFRFHLETLLTRDIQILYPTRIPYPTMLQVCIELAQMQGHNCNLSEIARRTSLSAPTLSKLLQALSGLFLIRNLGSTFYFEDQGLASYLSPGTAQTPKLFDLRRWVFQELFAQLTYHHAGQFTLERIQTRGGLEIPFVVRFRDGTQLAILIDPGNRATERSLKSAAWIKRRLPKARILILHGGSEPEISPRDIISIPYSWIA